MKIVQLVHRMRLTPWWIYIKQTIQIEHDFEDESLYIITFWLENDPLRYLCLARDYSENPNQIYIEFLDQIYGFETNKAKFLLENQIMHHSFTLYLDRELDFLNLHFLNNDNKITIQLDTCDLSAITKTLAKIFDGLVY
ncbi:hypothetical protein [Psychrobacter sp. I-STPA6b]|uniref:hypothetical protein n=1 Tax=Psychrobacter sp. I-STPA6b TaxID=2585718 RepID=UPI001D0C609A|nr:hypothetical protein [Psychrobacter sp. I-STPA6b]